MTIQIKIILLDLNQNVWNEWKISGSFEKKPKKENRKIEKISQKRERERV